MNKSNLTPKQRAFAHAYIETGSAPEAAMRVYDCSNRNSARVIAHRNLHNPKIQEYMSSQVADMVLAKKSIKRLDELMDARKLIKLGRHGVMEVPDNQARGNALELYCKLLHMSLNPK